MLCSIDCNQYFPNKRLYLKITSNNVIMGHCIYIEWLNTFNGSIRNS